MERKINEIFEYKGARIQAIEDSDFTCARCYFNERKTCNIHCLPSERTDKKNVIFIEVKE